MVQLVIMSEILRVSYGILFWKKYINERQHQKIQFCYYSCLTTYTTLHQLLSSWGQEHSLDRDAFRWSNKSQFAYDLRRIFPSGILLVYMS